jgi:hypothetical protein
MKHLARLKRLAPMKRSLLLLAAGLSFSTVACAFPAAVVRVEPESAEVVWRSGRGISEHEEPGLRLAAAYDHEDLALASHGLLAFRVEVQNTGATRLEVDPAEMTYTTCRSDTDCLAERPVANPEDALSALDLAQTNEQAAATNAAGLGAALLLLDVTASVGAVASGKYHHANELAVSGAIAGSNAEARVAEHENNVSIIDSARQSWAAVALRRTTLFPGQGLAGMVYVPVEEQSSHVWLRVRVAGRGTWFKYRQTVIAPPASSASASASRRAGYD